MQGASTATCPKCSATLPDGALFCHRCGTPTPPVLSGAGQMQYTSESEAAGAQQRAELRRLLGDSCELRGLIGRGGFADVYEAWDPRLKRRLAVKTLRSDLVTSTALVERFRLEAEAIAQLRHPHVIPIYSVGGEGSVAYFVMPKVDGESLAGILARDERISVEESCRILREAASALATAHRAGIIHRDVKPENILLDGPERRVLVMDFGIAKSLDASEKGLTGTGMLVGTPQYMSPEQAAGDRNIDHRSDQYALAIVGYRMLTGRLPFDGDSAQTIIFRQVTESATPVAEANPAVPQSVSTVIDRALSKRPEDRFESMDVFNRELDKATQAALPKSGRLPIPNMATRIETMRRELPRLRSPLTIAAALATIAALVLMPRTISRAAHEDAAKREDAVFAAKSFLAGRGVTGSLSHFAEFAERDSTMARKFLRATIGAGALDERAATDLSLWGWRVHLKTDSLPVPWTVEVGRRNRIVEFAQRLPDSASAPRTTPRQAEAVAMGELTARGLSASSLRRIGDSTITRTNRTDHLFRWVRNDGAVRSAAGDSAFPTVVVRVSGEAVTGYSEHFATPRTFQEQNDRSGQDPVFGVLLFLIFALGVGIAIAVVVSQSRRDELQWRTGWLLALAMLLGTVTPFVNELRGSLFLGTAGDGASSATAAILGMIFICGAVLLGTVIGESLGAMHRPVMFAGVSDLTRGRLTPELATATVNGVLWGGVTYAALQSVALAYAWVNGGPHGLSVEEFSWTLVPAVDSFGEFAGGIGVALFLASVQLVVYHWRPSTALALATPILIVAAFSLGAPNGRSFNAVPTLVGFAVVGFVTWRHGVIAGALAAFLSSILQSLGPALLIGTSGGPGGVAAAIAVVVAVLAPGFIAYRRSARVVSPIRTTP